MAFLTDWIQQIWQVFLEAGPWLVVGFLVAGVIHVLVPVDKVTRHLGKPGLGGILKAALVGAPLPLCSCSVIPVASAIRRQGASRGATASFLISTPETGVDSIALSYAMLGPVMAIIRPLAAVMTAILTGLAINRWGEAESQSPVETAASMPGHGSPPGRSCCESTAPGHGQARPAAGCCSTTTSHSSAAHEHGLLARIGRGSVSAVRYGYGRMFEDLAHWLILGFVLAGLVSAMFPPDFIERHVGTGPWALLLMLVIGLPMYVCATASTPVAAALILKGLSPGAALVFLLVGPATNAATMVIVARELGRRSLVLYLAGIAVVALFFGWATDYLIGLQPSLAASIHQHVHGESSESTWPLAAVLALLILNGLRMRIARRLAAARATRLAAAPAHACCERS